MEDTELGQLLEQLHQEIKTTKSIDETEAALLHDLETEIRELLERCQAEPFHTHPGVLERLEDAIDALAVNHPTLTAMLANMLTTLSNAGV